MNTSASDSSNEPIEVKIIAAASDGMVNVTPAKCEAIRQILLRIREETLKDEKERMKQNIGLLRQWLNEDRITNREKMVSNEDIAVWFDISKTT